MSKAASKGFRIEHDSMGELQVPADALWRAQTQRAVQNFPVSGQRMPRGFIRALGLVKGAAAGVNAELGHLPKNVAKAIQTAAAEVAAGNWDAQFPIDVYQTGSGTSSNMNANEVIATLANRAGKAGKTSVHPNDHVNQGQSSNDVIPTALRVSAVLATHEQLLPALVHLRKTLDKKGRSLRKVVKTGRTHLMDAMPLTFEQEFGAWSAQLASAQERIEDSLKRVRRLPLGGTAIGTGINADPRFGAQVAEALKQQTGFKFDSAENKFEGLAAQDDAVELSGQLNALAVALIKIANDLRWMNAGPLAGLGEIELPALQPGSSIMPGKVNPVIPEATVMACAQVIGHHTAITVAGQTGNFQLNVTLPLIAVNLLDGIGLLANVSTLLADSAIAGLKVREDRVAEALARNPILVTALNPIIGYEKAAAIAKRAYKEQRPVLDVALEDSGLEEAELRRLLDPTALTAGGIQAGGGGNTVRGGLGNDQILGAQWSDDRYLFARGDGQDLVADGGGQDRLVLEDVRAEQLWFSQSGNDLDVSVIGSQDRITLQNWYLGNQYHVEQFETSDGKTLLDSQVQNLVSAMAAFAPPAAGQTTLAANYAAALTPVIVANWQ